MLVLAAVSAAMVAMPAAASAQSWHLSQTTNFSVTGFGGSLTWTTGMVISCTSTTAAGSFSTTTEGKVSIVFHACTSPIGVTCTSPGQPAGTVAISAKFDAIMVSTNKPGLLLTPEGVFEPTSGQKTLWEMSCLGFVERIFGRGLIGTISAPGCGVASSTGTVTFSSSSSGHQEDKTYTGITYDLASTLNGSHPTFSLNAVWSLAFPAARTMTCTH